MGELSLSELENSEVVRSRDMASSKQISCERRKACAGCCRPESQLQSSILRDLTFNRLSAIFVSELELYALQREFSGL